MGVEVISLYYMGSLGDITIFAATGMAMTVMNVVVMSILFGSIRGMETLVSQAIGKDDTELVIAYMNRGRMILFVMYVPLGCILWFTEPLLLLVGQNEQVAHYAAIYARISLPGIFFYSQFNYMRRFLLQLRIVYSPLLVILAATAGHFGWNYLLVYKWGWGIYGGGTALSLTYFTDFVLIYIFASFYPPSKEYMKFQPAVAM